MINIKKSFRVRWFVSGALTSLLTCALIVSAVAQSYTIQMNTVNVGFRGETVANAGESLTVGNTQVPWTLVYTDEFGNGTTYLPIRQISDLMGVSINWDSETGTVMIGQGTRPPQPGVDGSPAALPSGFTYQQFVDLNWQVDDQWQPQIPGEPIDLTRVRIYFDATVPEEQFLEVVTALGYDVEKPDGPNLNMRLFARYYGAPFFDGYDTKPNGAWVVYRINGVEIFSGDVNSYIHSSEYKN